jgi:DNA repair exonuclease SbcCD ATPase subunit
MQAREVDDLREKLTAAGDLRAALSDSVSQVKALQQQIAQADTRSEQSLAEERAKTAAVAASRERAAVAAASRRVTELEAHIEELNDAVETLTLDKEQQSLEKEEALELVEQLQCELEGVKLDQEHAALSATDTSTTSTTTAGGTAAAAASSVSEGSSAVAAELELVHAQNSQLKEALKRLHDLSSADKAELGKKVSAYYHPNHTIITVCCMYMQFYCLSLARRTCSASVELYKH